MYRWLFAAWLALGGCALVSAPSPDSTRKDLALGDAPADLAFGVRSNDDMAMMPSPRPNDAGKPLATGDLARPIAPGDMAMVACSAAQHLVINEVQIDGA